MVRCHTLLLSGLALDLGERGVWEEPSVGLSEDLGSHPNFGTTSLHHLGKQFSVTGMWVAPREGWERAVAFGFYPEGGEKCLKRRHIIRSVL